MKKIIFLTWARYHRRPEILAQHFKAKSFFISSEQGGRRLLLPIRYLVQAWKSWRVFHQEQPDIVIVQNPPIFCALVAFLYGKMYGAQYAIDSHTGAFLSPKWRWSRGLHRILSKSARVTIVHNASQEKIVKEWGCRYVVIGFTPGSYPLGEEFALERQAFNVAVISSFHEDEPLDLVFKASALLPNVHFYVTGDSKRVSQSSLSNKPVNCILTGYLSYEKYIGLLRKVDAVMVLTTSNHTLLMGAFEGVSLGIPLIISDWPILRSYFAKGTVYVQNTTKSICEGVGAAQNNKNMLKQEILDLRDLLEKEWNQRFTELRKLLLLNESDH